MFGTLHGGEGAGLYASDAARLTAAQAIPLEDGGIIYMFKDGKMAKEDRYWRAQYLRGDDTLQTADDK